MVGAKAAGIELKTRDNRSRTRDVARGGERPLRAALPISATLIRTPHCVRITVAGPLKLRGGIKRVEGWSKEDLSSSVPRLDNSLIRALARAHRWRAAIEQGEIAGIDDLAKREGLHRRRVRELLRLAFLAPDVQRAIVDGQQPGGLTIERLTEVGPPISLAAAETSRPRAIAAARERGSPPLKWYRIRRRRSISGKALDLASPKLRARSHIARGKAAECAPLRRSRPFGAGCCRMGGWGTRIRT